MHPEETETFTEWVDRLAHPVVVPILLAAVVGIIAHSLVFAELTGPALIDLPAGWVRPATTHFAWYCTGCGLALMMAAFALLR